MNREFKARWLEALRSGRYEQTQGQLFREQQTQDIPPGYCCLGVACDLDKKRFSGEWRNEAFIYSYLASSGNLVEKDDLGMPSFPLTEAWGLHEEDIETLARMNDGFADDFGHEIEPKSFAEIADWIEENL